MFLQCCLGASLSCLRGGRDQEVKVFFLQDVIYGFQRAGVRIETRQGSGIVVLQYHFFCLSIFISGGYGLK